MFLEEIRNKDLNISGVYRINLFKCFSNNLLGYIKSRNYMCGLNAKRQLILDFTYSGVSFTKKRNSNNLEAYIYYALRNRRDKYLNIDEYTYLAKDGLEQFYISGYNNPLVRLDELEMNKFINCILVSNRYDYISIYSGDSFSESERTVHINSRDLYFVKLNEFDRLQKIELRRIEEYISCFEIGKYDYEELNLL